MDDPELLAHLEEQRRHVLRGVEGLTDGQLEWAMVPSGWTITRLLTHLTYDDEMFWIGAVLGGETSAIEALRDGWAPIDGMSGAEAVALYRSEIRRSNELLAGLDLSAAPRWWPPATVFDAPPMRSGREVLFRVLTETAVHAGHLDIVRELIDGHQHIVVP